MKNLKINDLINYNLAFLSFLVPLAKGAALLHIFTYTLILLWLIEGRFKYKFELFKKRFNVALAFLFIFFFFQFISFFWSADIYHGYWSGYHSNGIEFFLKRKILYLFILIVAITSLKEKFIEKILYAFIYAMFISEIFSYLLIFKIIEPFKERIPSFPSPFLNHSVYTMFLVIFILLLIDNYSKLKNKAFKLISALFIVTSTLNLFLNSGRTGQVLFPIALLFYFINRYKVTFKNIISTLSLIIFIFLTSYNFIPLFQKRANLAFEDMKKVLYQNRYDSSWGGRYLSLLIAKESFKENNYFGVGKGSAREYAFSKAKGYDKNSYNYYTKHLHSDMHNQYAQIFIESGLLGLISILIFFIYYIFIFKYYKYNAFFKSYFLLFAIALFFGNFLDRFETYILFNIFLSLATFLKEERI